MTGKELTKKAHDLKNQMKTRRTSVKGTISELKLLIACRMEGEYTPMFTTKLYTVHGGEYCEYLQLLC